MESGTSSWIVGGLWAQSLNVPANGGGIIKSVETVGLVKYDDLESNDSEGNTSTSTVGKPTASEIHAKRHHSSRAPSAAAEPAQITEPSSSVTVAKVEVVTPSPPPIVHQPSPCDPDGPPFRVEGESEKKKEESEKRKRKHSASESGEASRTTMEGEGEASNREEGTASSSKHHQWQRKGKRGASGLPSKRKTRRWKHQAIRQMRSTDTAAPSIKQFGNWTNGESSVTCALRPTHIPEPNKILENSPWICCLCQKDGSEENGLGPLYGPFYIPLGHQSWPPFVSSPDNSNTTKWNLTNCCLDAWFHGKCALWARGIWVHDGELMVGKKVLRNHWKQLCSSCGKVGANVHCMVRCETAYHYGCAVQAGVFMDEGSLKFCCPLHWNETVKPILKGNTKHMSKNQRKKYRKRFRNLGILIDRK